MILRGCPTQKGGALISPNYRRLLWVVVIERRLHSAISARFERKMRTASGKSLSMRCMVTVSRCVHLVEFSFFFFVSDAQGKPISSFAGAEILSGVWSAIAVCKIPGTDKESHSETRGGSEVCKSLLRTGTGERAKANSRGRPYFFFF